MIKDNQKNFSRLHMLIDVFVIAASYALKKTRLSSHAKRTETALKKKIATGKVATGKNLP